MSKPELINAALIAAAPEMLVALETLARYAAAEIDVPYDQCKAGAIGNARAIIERLQALQECGK